MTPTLGKLFKGPRFLHLIVLLVLLGSLFAVRNLATHAGTNEDCRPDGMYKTPGVDTPYCLVYDTAGREKMNIPRRIIGYFPSWRTGKNGQPRYLASDIPWSKITHINYAFAHIGSDNKISVGTTS